MNKLIFLSTLSILFLTSCNEEKENMKESLNAEGIEDLENNECGWVFRSNQNIELTKTGSKKHYDDIEFYVDYDCNAGMKIVYANGEEKYYYVKNNAKLEEGYTDDGNPYWAIDMFNSKTGEEVRFQVLQSESSTHLSLEYENENMTVFGQYKK